jgi:hypothetical protein
MNGLYEIIKAYYSGDMQAAMQQRITAMLPLLDERQRRLFLANEARALGPGGITQISRISGVARFTIKRGITELEHSGAMFAAQCRRPSRGTGLRLGNQDIMNDLKKMMGLSSARGEDGLLRHTGMSIQNMVDQLAGQGLPMNPIVIGNLLKEQGYRLRTNRNKMAIGRRHPDLDAQFRYINKRAKAFTGRGEPVLFLDLKELDETKKARGAGLEPLEYDRDALAGELGAANPLGVYGLFRNSGLESTVLNDGTAGFAVRSLKYWWEAEGRERWGAARRILITADSEGGGGWVAQLQGLANEMRKELTVLYFPPGITRWDGVGRRYYLFAGEEQEGKPRVKAAVVISVITGDAEEGSPAVGYIPGPVYRPEPEAEAAMRRHEFHGDWNYTILPRKRKKKAGGSYGT